MLWVGSRNHPRSCHFGWMAFSAFVPVRSVGMSATLNLKDTQGLRPCVIKVAAG